MYRINHLIAVFFTAIIVFGSLHAIAGQVSKGDKIPHTLSLIDKDGQEQSFESLKGPKGAVIYFVRSADWCPYCQVQLLDLKDYGSEIEAAGFSILTVSYDSSEKLKAFADQYRFPYAMLSDEGSEAIKAFGILNEDVDKASSRYGIPHPTVYVVHSDGTIKSKLSEKGHRERPQSERVLEALK